MKQRLISHASRCRRVPSIVELDAGVGRDPRPHLEIGGDDVAELRLCLDRRFAEHLESLAVKGRLVDIGRMWMGRMGSSTAQIDITQQIDITPLWLKRLKPIGVTFRTRSEEERLAVAKACARDFPAALFVAKLVVL